MVTLAIAIPMFDDELDLETLVQEASMRQRTQFQNAQVAKQETVEQQTLGEDLGWNSTFNARLCRLPDGSVIAADSIAPQAGTGLVAISRPAQGRPTIKSPL